MHALLGVLYQVQEKYEEAKPLLESALAIRKQQLGATHPDTATSLHSLGMLSQVQGKYEEAKLLLKRALAIRKRYIASCSLTTK